MCHEPLQSPNCGQCCNIQPAAADWQPKPLCVHLQQHHLIPHAKQYVSKLIEQLPFPMGPEGANVLHHVFFGAVFGFFGAGPLLSSLLGATGMCTAPSSRECVTLYEAGLQMCA